LTSVDWLEVRLSGPESICAYVEVQLQGQGFPGWVDESVAGEGFCYLVYVPQESGWQDRVQQLQRSAEQLGARFSRHGLVRDEDWAENWKRFYHPLKVGEHLVVCPSWEAYEAAADDVVLILDPGSAFGTGYHWSTRLCLEALEEVSPCSSVLDLGTGSGILAIAAHKLGFREILALDNDPVAVKVAAENLQINGATDVRVRLASSPEEGPFQLVLANLIASLLVELAGPLAECLKVGGTLICGGIIQERRTEVVEALQAVGLRLESFKEQEEWASLRMVRP